MEPNDLMRLNESSELKRSKQPCRDPNYNYGFIFLHVFSGRN